MKEDDAKCAITFALAELACGTVYSAQGGPAKSHEERFKQQLARERRDASAFEELYCLIRDIADDWHRQAIRRRDGEEPGTYTEEFCDAEAAVQGAFHAVLEHIKNWDY